MIGDFDSIFNDFPPQAKENWRAQAEKELKGEPFESLVWRNENGFDVQPYFTKEDIRHEYAPAFGHHFFNYCVNGDLFDDAALNAYLLRPEHRIDISLWLDVRGRSLDKSLHNVKLTAMEFHLLSDEKHLPDIARVFEGDTEIFVSIHPVSVTSRSELKSWTGALNRYKWNECISGFTLDLTGFSEAAALPYYELAIYLAQMREWAETVEKKGQSLPGIHCLVKTSVNCDYFTMIAKLRAMRRLTGVLDLFTPDDVRILAQTTLSNKQVGEPYNNLIRTSVEAMAAVAGGANSVMVHGFGAVEGKNDAFSQRIAINQLRLIGQESRLSELADVGCGSYYLESLTDALAARALEAYKEIQMQGGYFACLEKGVFQREIEAQRKQRRAGIQEGKTKVVGVNVFQAPRDGDFAERVKKAAAAFPLNEVAGYELSALKDNGKTA